MDESEIFHILGNDRRREIINSFAESREPITLSELATEIATHESDDEPPEDLYKSVYVSLQQTHLPKMADEGIIAYDRDAKTIEPGPKLDEVEVYVGDRQALRQPLYSPPLVVSVLALATIVAALLGVPVVSAVDIGVWAVLFLLVIIGTMLVQSVE